MVPPSVFLASLIVRRPRRRLHRHAAPAESDAPESEHHSAAAEATLEQSTGSLLGPGISILAPPRPSAPPLSVLGEEPRPLVGAGSVSRRAVRPAPDTRAVIDSELPIGGSRPATAASAVALAGLNHDDSYEDDFDDHAQLSAASGRESVASAAGTATTAGNWRDALDAAQPERASSSRRMVAPAGSPGDPDRGAGAASRGSAVWAPSSQLLAFDYDWQDVGLRLCPRDLVFLEPGSLAPVAARPLRLLVSIQSLRCADGVVALFWAEGPPMLVRCSRRDRLTMELRSLLLAAGVDVPVQEVRDASAFWLEWHRCCPLAGMLVPMAPVGDGRDGPAVGAGGAAVAGTCWALPPAVEGGEDDPDAAADFAWVREQVRWEASLARVERSWGSAGAALDSAVAASTVLALPGDAVSSTSHPLLLRAALSSSAGVRSAESEPRCPEARAAGPLAWPAFEHPVWGPPGGAPAPRSPRDWLSRCVLAPASLHPVAVYTARRDAACLARGDEPPDGGPAPGSAPGTPVRHAPASSSAAVSTPGGRAQPHAHAASRSLASPAGIHPAISAAGTPAAAVVNPPSTPESPRAGGPGRGAGWGGPPGSRSARAHRRNHTDAAGLPVDPRALSRAASPAHGRSATLAPAAAAAGVGPSSRLGPLSPLSLLDGGPGGSDDDVDGPSSAAAWFLTRPQAPAAAACPVVLARTATSLLELWPADVVSPGRERRRVLVVAQSWPLALLAGLLPADASVSPLGDPAGGPSARPGLGVAFQVLPLPGTGLPSSTYAPAGPLAPLPPCSAAGARRTIAAVLPAQGSARAARPLQRRHALAAWPAAPGDPPVPRGPLRDALRRLNEDRRAALRPAQGLSPAAVVRVREAAGFATDGAEERGWRVIPPWAVADAAAQAVTGAASAHGPPTAPQPPAEQGHPARWLACLAEPACLEAARAAALDDVAALRPRSAACDVTAAAAAVLRLCPAGSAMPVTKRAAVEASVRVTAALARRWLDAVAAGRSTALGPVLDALEASAALTARLAECRAGAEALVGSALSGAASSGAREHKGHPLAPLLGLAATPASALAGPSRRPGALVVMHRRARRACLALVRFVLTCDAADAADASAPAGPGPPARSPLTDDEEPGRLGSPSRPARRPAPGGPAVTEARARAALRVRWLPASLVASLCASCLDDVDGLDTDAGTAPGAAAAAASAAGPACAVATGLVALLLLSAGPAAADATRAVLAAGRVRNRAPVTLLLSRSAVATLDAGGDEAAASALLLLAAAARLPPPPPPAGATAPTPARDLVAAWSSLAAAPLALVTLDAKPPGGGAALPPPACPWSRPVLLDLGGAAVAAEGDAAVPDLAACHAVPPALAPPPALAGARLHRDDARAATRSADLALAPASEWLDDAPDVGSGGGLQAWQRETGHRAPGAGPSAVVRCLLSQGCAGPARAVAGEAEPEAALRRCRAPGIHAFASSLQLHGGGSSPWYDPLLPLWLAHAMSAHGGGAERAAGPRRGPAAAPSVAGAAAVLVAACAAAGSAALVSVLSLLPPGSGTALADGLVPVTGVQAASTLCRATRAVAGPLAAALCSADVVPVPGGAPAALALALGHGAPAPAPYLVALASWLPSPSGHASGPLPGSSPAVVPPSWSAPRLAAAALLAAHRAEDIAGRAGNRHALLALAAAVTTVTDHEAGRPRIGPALVDALVDAPWPAPEPNSLSAGGLACLALLPPDLPPLGLVAPPHAVPALASAALRAYTAALRAAGVHDVTAKDASAFFDAVRAAFGAPPASALAPPGPDRRPRRPMTHHVASSSASVAGSVAASPAPALIGRDAALAAFAEPACRGRHALLRAAAAALGALAADSTRSHGLPLLLAEDWAPLLGPTAGVIGSAVASALTDSGDAAAAEPWLRRVLGEARLVLCAGGRAITDACRPAPRAAAADRAALLALAAGAGAFAGAMEVAEATLPLALAAAASPAPDRCLLLPSGADLLAEPAGGAAESLPHLSGVHAVAAAGPWAVIADALRAAAATALPAALPEAAALQAAVAGTAGPRGCVEDGDAGAAAPHATTGCAATPAAAAARCAPWEPVAPAVTSTVVSVLEAASAAAVAVAAALAGAPGRAAAAAADPPRPCLGTRPDDVIASARLAVSLLESALLPALASSVAATPRNVLARRAALARRAGRALLLALLTPSLPDASGRAAWLLGRAHAEAALRAAAACRDMEEEARAADPDAAIGELTPSDLVEAGWATAEDEAAELLAGPWSALPGSAFADVLPPAVVCRLWELPPADAAALLRAGGSPLVGMMSLGPDGAVGPGGAAGAAEAGGGRRPVVVGGAGVWGGSDAEAARAALAASLVGASSVAAGVLSTRGRASFAAGAGPGHVARCDASLQPWVGGACVPAMAVATAASASHDEGSWSDGPMALVADGRLEGARDRLLDVAHRLSLADTAVLASVRQAVSMVGCLADSVTVVRDGAGGAEGSPTENLCAERCVSIAGSIARVWAPGTVPERLVIEVLARAAEAAAAVRPGPADALVLAAAASCAAVLHHVRRDAEAMRRWAEDGSGGGDDDDDGRDDDDGTEGGGPTAHPSLRQVEREAAPSVSDLAAACVRHAHAVAGRGLGSPSPPSSSLAREHVDTAPSGAVVPVDGAGGSAVDDVARAMAALASPGCCDGAARASAPLGREAARGSDAAAEAAAGLFSWLADGSEGLGTVLACGGGWSLLLSAACRGPGAARRRSVAALRALVRRGERAGADGGPAVAFVTRLGGLLDARCLAALTSASGAAQDADVEARLAEIGADAWASAAPCKAARCIAAALRSLAEAQRTWWGPVRVPRECAADSGPVGAGWIAPRFGRGVAAAWDATVAAAMAGAAGGGGGDGQAGAAEAQAAVAAAEAQAGVAGAEAQVGFAGAGAQAVAAEGAPADAAQEGPPEPLDEAPRPEEGPHGDVAPPAGAAPQPEAAPPAGAGALAIDAAPLAGAGALAIDAAAGPAEAVAADEPEADEPAAYEPAADEPAADPSGARGGGEAAAPAQAPLGDDGNPVAATPRASEDGADDDPREALARRADARTAAAVAAVAAAAPDSPAAAAAAPGGDDEDPATLGSAAVEFGFSDSDDDA